MIRALAELKRRVPAERPCEEAVAWLEDGNYPSLQAAWDVCSCADWMEWLARKLGLLPLTARRAYEKATAPAWRAYREDTTPAWRIYQEAKAAALRQLIPPLPPEEEPDSQ